MTSSEVPSVKVAVAVNDCDCPAAIVTEIGLIEIETMVAGVTVTDVVPDTVPKVAVIVALPTARPVTFPVASTPATAVAEEDQATVADTSCVLPSLNEPIAESCAEIPADTVMVPVPIVIVCKVAAVTVTPNEEDTDPNDAVTVALPGASPWRSPEEDTVATAGFELE